MKDSKNTDLVTNLLNTSSGSNMMILGLGDISVKETDINIKKKPANGVSWQMSRFFKNVDVKNMRKTYFQ